MSKCFSLKRGHCVWSLPPPPPKRDVNIIKRIMHTRLGLTRSMPPEVPRWLYPTCPYTPEPKRGRNGQESEINRNKVQFFSMAYHGGADIMLSL